MAEQRPSEFGHDTSVSRELISNERALLGTLISAYLYLSSVLAVFSSYHSRVCTCPISPINPEAAFSKVSSCLFEATQYLHKEQKLGKCTGLGLHPPLW